MTLRCPHCDSPVPDDCAARPYCCAGCRAAHRLLADEGLERFYALRGGPGVPVGGAGSGGGLWLEALVEQARAHRDAEGTLSLSVDVQGMHCAGCVFVIEKLFSREEGARHVEVNPALGRLTLHVEDGAFAVGGFLEKLARLGYRAGPAAREGDVEGRELLLRFGVVTALAMNSMILSFAGYFGLGPDEGSLESIFRWVNLGLATLAVLVGAPVFLRGVLEGLRAKVFHLDLPIALGMVLAYAGSALSVLVGDGRAAYLDTLTVFIALMLLGRLVQHRVLAANQRLVLADEGVRGLFARRIDEDSRVETVPASRLGAGDRLLLAPGELAPVRARLLDDADALSLAWINGESAPASKKSGEEIPAGAENQGGRAIRAEALEDFAASRLNALLEERSSPSDSLRRGDFWARVAQIYVAAVLLLAVVGGGLWAQLAGTSAALDVVVALLVVTCPCALGLAAPLGAELGIVRLRRAGIFVRSVSLLDRVLDVRRVLFDKTGTLTLGTLRVVEEGSLRALDTVAQSALAQMTLRSRHPKSRALLEALRARGEPRLEEDASVVEVAGQGLELVRGDARWRLGRPSFTLDGAPAGEDDDVVLSRGGRAVARFSFEEELRPDARAEVQRLSSDGIRVELLSGDDGRRVRALAERIGLDVDRARGDLSPEDKAAHIRAVDRRDTLMVGDGINDALALEAAYCAGTPAIDHPSVPSRADFFLLGDGLSPLSDLLAVSRKVRRVLVRNLAFAVLYNGVTVGIALAGHMNPLVAAVLMPASSVFVVVHTALSLAPPPFARALLDKTRRAAGRLGDTVEVRS